MPLTAPCHLFHSAFTLECTGVIPAKDRKTWTVKSIHGPRSSCNSPYRVCGVSLFLIRAMREMKPFLTVFDPILSQLLHQPCIILTVIAPNQHIESSSQEPIVGLFARSIRLTGSSLIKYCENWRKNYGVSRKICATLQSWCSQQTYWLEDGIRPYQSAVFIAR